MSAERMRAIIAGNGQTAPLEGDAALATRVGRNGRDDETALPPDPAHRRAHRLLQYLPGIYSSDDFAARFLGIFEHILDPIEQQVRNLPYYFDPPTAPPALVPWLAEWVAQAEGAGWPLAAQRGLIKNAVRIFTHRGTLAGLKLHLQALGVADPLITDNGDGFRLGHDARLGYNTHLGRERPGWFTVTLPVADPAALDTDLAREAIESSQPVGARYVLRIVKE